MRALLILWYCCAASGCVIWDSRGAVRNPVPELGSVAVAPFFNLSQERSVDGRRFAMAYYAELQKIPGFKVVPVGITETAIINNDLQMSSPEDALKLAEILGVDAVVVGAVTDYHIYEPPRVGLQVSWYSPRAWEFAPGVQVDPYARKKDRFEERFRKEQIKLHEKMQRAQKTHNCKDPLHCPHPSHDEQWELEDDFETLPAYRGQSPEFADGSVGTWQNMEFVTGRPVPVRRNWTQMATVDEVRLNGGNVASAQPSRSPARPTLKQFGPIRQVSGMQPLRPDPKSGGAPPVLPNSSVNAPGLLAPAPAMPMVEGPQPGIDEPARPDREGQPEGFDPRVPLMSYTRIFDATDPKLAAALRDYVELTGDQRSGGWQAYLHRSEDFIRFTAHLMIVEMLTLHGGEGKRQFVFKLRKYK